MDVQLDLSMRTAGVLEGWRLRDYHAEYKCVLNSLSDGLEASLIDGDCWYKDNQYLYYKDRIVVPEAQLDGCLQWAHLSSWRTGCNRSVDFFRKPFYSQLTCVELRARMQSIVHFCGFHARKQSNSRDRGLVFSLPIPYCANYLLYVEFSTVCLSLVGITVVWLSPMAYFISPLRSPATKRSQGNQL